MINNLGKEILKLADVWKCYIRIKLFIIVSED